MPQITTITFFKFKSWAHKLWALSMMGLAHRSLDKATGQTFYKLMGSGRGTSFNVLPDWSTYVLLQVWETEEHAEAFLSTSDIMREYRLRSSELWTAYLRSTNVHGQWDGNNPFRVEDTGPAPGPVMVLTRAAIKWSKVLSFWRFVPHSQQTLKENGGLLFTKGVGEVPVVQMATISLWKDLASLKKFAYESEGHREAIRRTSVLKWYKEELFARFRPYRSVGTWNGKDQLAGFEELGG